MATSFPTSIQQHQQSIRYFFLILTLVDARPETSFLEPGVGTGLNVLPLIKQGYSVTGIDVSQEMLNQLCQKLHEIPQNLNLIHADASRLPFSNESFDVVLTVHMIHTVDNWKTFLNESDRVLKSKGFYLNAQWVTPPARLEFECYFRDILSQYSESKNSKHIDTEVKDINVEEYFCNKGYQLNYLIAKKWTVSNTFEELLNFFKSRAYGNDYKIPS